MRASTTAAKLRIPDEVAKSDLRGGTSSSRAPLGRHEDAPKHELLDTRNQALAHTSLADVQHLSPDGLRTLKVILGHGSEPGRWHTPSRWNSARVPAALTDINLRQRIVHCLCKLQHQVGSSERLHGDDLLTGCNASRLVDAATLQFERFLVLCRLAKSGIGKRGLGRSLAPSTIIEHAYSILPWLFAAAVLRAIENNGLGGARLGDEVDGSGIMAQLSVNDLKSLSPRVQEAAVVELERMRRFARDGLWSDLPSITVISSSATPVAGPRLAPRRQPRRDTHLPLPDDYVAALGQRCIWLIRSVGPMLLLLASQILEVLNRKPASLKRRDSTEARRLSEIEGRILEFRWVDDNGNFIDASPFELHLRTVGNRHGRFPVRWPPQSAIEVVALLRVVQAAHVFVVLLSMGSRKSEVLSLRRDCVQYSPANAPNALGKTFKLVRRHDGEWREWPLPDLAIKAIEQQRRLVSVAERICEPLLHMDAIAPPIPSVEPTHLWAQIGIGSNSNAALEMRDCASSLKTLVRAFNLDSRPGGQYVRPHRLRKTIARLAALALTQAPKVLADVFGHRSIEMTLYYILEDKGLQAEVERVSRELRVMRAKDVVATMVAAEDVDDRITPYAGYGGPAAATLQNAVQVHRNRLHQAGKRWNASSTAELATILTLNGTAWQLVRRGVICTKFPGTESGPCNQSKGHPEPSKCQSDCRHRLEEQFLRNDVDGAISQSLESYEAAGRTGDLFMQEYWATQVRAHLGRFDDLREKWMQNEAVKLLINTPPVRGELQPG